jgi:hypothetical protein
MASVAPDVKITWRGRVAKSDATCSRPSSSATLAMRPSVCTRPGSAELIHGSMASMATGRTGEVEAWSR